VKKVGFGLQLSGFGLSLMKLSPPKVCFGTVPLV
jgi:hypothetical protein